MQTPATYKFDLGQQASIAVSGETGQIIARAEYTTGTNSYLLRYKSADGRAVEAWWNEDAIALDSSPAPCAYCNGSGTCRNPYSAVLGPCAACATRPSSTANATTDASVNPDVSRA